MMIKEVWLWHCCLVVERRSLRFGIMLYLSNFVNNVSFDCYKMLITFPKRTLQIAIVIC